MKFLWVSSILVVAWAATVQAAPTNVSIAAVVGDDVITTTDVVERTALIMATTGIPDSAENQQKIRPRIIQSLIDETLQLQEAKRQALMVSDEDLNKAVDALQTRGDNPEPVRVFVKKRGLSMRSLENQLRAQQAWAKVVQRKLRRNVSVSQDEIRRAQLSASASPGEEELRLQALEFTASGKGKDAATHKLVEDAALALKSGEDMATIAARLIRNPAVHYSPPSWVATSQLPPMLAQALRTIKPGETSPPLASGRTVQLLQVMERSTAPKLADETEYALKQIAITMPKKRDKASLAKLREVAASLRKNPGDCTSETVPMVTVPVEVSMVRTQLGALSPAQRGVVSHLEVGDVSEPLMGTDAIRLVLMCEKIEPAGGALPEPEKIRQQLFAEKIELEAQKHLRNLRRDAYIDIKDASE